MAGKVSDFDRWIRTINEPRGSGPGTPATHTVHLTVMQFTPHVGWCVFQERLLLVFRLVPALDWNGTRVVVGLVVCACAARLVSWQKKKKIELDRSVECLRINGNPIWGIDFFIPSRPLAEVGWWVRGTARGRRNNSEHTHTHTKKKEGVARYSFTRRFYGIDRGRGRRRRRGRGPPSSATERTTLQLLTGHWSRCSAGCPLIKISEAKRKKKKDRQRERERERERTHWTRVGTVPQQGPPGPQGAEVTRKAGRTKKKANKRLTDWKCLGNVPVIFFFVASRSLGPPPFSAASSTALWNTLERRESRDDGHPSGVGRKTLEKLST